VIKKVARDLLLAHAVVFLLVGSVFSLAVYIHVINNIQSEEKTRLLTLTQAVANYAQNEEEPDAKDPTKSVPDILLATNKNFPIKGSTLQWFNVDGRMVSQIGSISLSAPFTTKEDFQEQDHPHALLMTVPVVERQKLMGYLRAAISLEDFDRYRKHLLFAMFFGVTLFLVFSTVGVIWLVRQSLRRLQETIDKLKQFTADASHELRSPLMAVKTNVAVALRHDEGMREKDREKFETINNATNQMIRTTTDLLRLSEIEGAAEPERTKLDLTALLASIANELGGTAQAKTIHMETLLEDEISIIAREDDARSVFGNVVQNAVQYTEPGGKISILANKHNKRATVKVVDSGIGIKSEELPKIFDRFWRSDKARSHHSGGNGLGLAIVMAIANQNGWHIAVTSQPQEGTTFVITVPCL
jgi:signal transduction histidine kinase